MLDLVEIGRKIRGYRQRAKLSQIDLELEIGASSGSISRTENGKINSDKETLLKIAKVLKMSPIETAGLFGIEINKLDEAGFGDHEQLYGQYQNTYENTYDFLQNLDVNKAFEESTKKIEEHGYHNICIYLIDPDTETFKLKKTTVPPSTLELAFELLRKDIYEVEFSLTDSTLITQAILTGKIQVSSQMFELIIPHLGELYSLQSSRNTQQVIALPLNIKSKVIGCITFQTKDSIVNAEIISELEKLGESVSKTIFTAELKKELDNKINVKAAKTTNNDNGLKYMFEFFDYKNILFLLKTDINMKIFAGLFIMLSFWWVFNQIFHIYYFYISRMFTYSYALMPVFAAYLGYEAYKFVGKNINSLGRILAILILITLLHIFGQIYNNYVLIFADSISYPSPSDLGFLGATLLGSYLSWSLYRYVKTKSTKIPFGIVNKCIYVLLVIIILVFKYINLFQIYDWKISNIWIFIFDSIYIIGQTLSVVISLLGLILIRKSVLSKEMSYFLILWFFSSILLYICDLVFTYRYYLEIYTAGDVVDFLYFLYYSLIAFGHVALLATIKKDIDIQKRESGLKDYKFTVEKVVNKLLD